MLRALRIPASAILGIALILSISAPPTQAQSKSLQQLTKRIVALQQMGKYAEAIPLAETLVARAESDFGKNHKTTATALNLLAGLLQKQGRYVDAEPLCKRALAIYEAAPEPSRDNFDLAFTLEQLGDLSSEQGRYSDAEAFYQRSVSLFEKSFGYEHTYVTSPLGGLGSVYLREGRYAEAERAYRRSLAILEKATATDKTVSADVAAMLVNLAGLLESQGRYEEAEAFFKRGIAIIQGVRGPKHPDVADHLYALGRLYNNQGRYNEAEPLYKRALSIREELLGPEHRLVAYSLHGLGRLYEQQHRYDEAEPLYRRALAIYEKVLPETHPEVGGMLGQLGFYYRTLGRDGDAEPLYRRALAIKEKSLPAGHPEIALSLANIAALEFRQNRYTESLATIRRATAIVEQRRANFKKGADDAALNNIWFFTHQVRAAFRVAEIDNTKSTSLVKESFRVGQWAIDTGAAGAVSQMSARLAAGDTALGRLVRERQDLETQWQAIDRALTSALSLAPERRAGADERARLRLAEIDSRTAALDAQLNAEFPQYYALVKGAPIESDEIANLLASDEALVQYVLAGEEGFAWLITPATQRWVRIAQPLKVILEKAEALDCGLDPSDWDSEKDRARCRELVGSPEKDDPLPFDLGKAHELFGILLGPFEDEIKGKRLLIAAGSLNGLPFNALVIEPPSETLPKTIEGYRKAKWLGSANAITVLPSVASLYALRKLAKGGHAPETFIGFGDPVLRGNPSCGTANIPSSCPGAPMARTSVSQRAAVLLGGSSTRSGPRKVARTAGQGFLQGGLANVGVLQTQCPLPETSFELKCVASSLGVPESQIRVREMATETAVKNATLDRYQIVYFATHGLLASETARATGSLAEPALMLTPPQTATAADDGLLTASEIAQLKLNADWVVMSACNTAGGGDTQGGEALSGLARAFFYAGARALLVSHWAVDSDAAVLLTTRTFAELKSNPTIGRAEALRRAMLAVIEDKARPDAAHPSFWAPFEVVGEGAAR
jgi:tetratricopeptide (TPR) repeat protein